MKNRNILNISLPLSLIIKINITRLLIIWESIAKYIYRVLLILLFFSSLILTEVFSYLNYWLHGILLVTFFVCLIVALLNLIYKMHWPTKIDCARRIEKDNNIENMPFSSLFDKPIQNEKSILWKEHYNRILKISLNLSVTKIKFLYFRNDPLFIRLPIIILFLFIFMAFNSDLEKKSLCSFDTRKTKY